MAGRIRRDYVIAPPLLATALYRRIPVEQREAIHLRFSRWLGGQDLDDHPAVHPELAFHLERGGRLAESRQLRERSPQVAAS